MPVGRCSQFASLDHESPTVLRAPESIRELEGSVVAIDHDTYLGGGDRDTHDGQGESELASARLQAGDRLVDVSEHVDSVADPKTLLELPQKWLGQADPTPDVTVPLLNPPQTVNEPSYSDADHSRPDGCHRR